jgi:hypothetical protein
MNPFSIFKVKQITTKNEIDHIWVFIGKNNSSTFSKKGYINIERINELFQTNPSDEFFTPIFSINELTEIKQHKIPITFIEDSIHLDDSIGLIKLKIFDAMQKKISMSEIYLFSIQKEEINPINLYQNLTQNDKLPLTYARMNVLLANLYNNKSQPLELEIPLKNKEQYTFEDIIQLDLPNRDYYFSKPLGQKFVLLNEYPIIANPFIVKYYDPILLQSKQELSTLNGNLLLESGSILDNTIYLCPAINVLEYNEVNNISSSYTTKIYYPFLYQNNIENLDTLQTNHIKLIEETNNKFNPNVERNIENINMFYNVFKEKKPSNTFSENVKQSGIINFKAILHPENKIKIPIEVIFKLLNSTKSYPLIKYNPDSKQENMYRLYSPDLSIDGKKIPFLSKTFIFKLMKTIGKRKSISIFHTSIFNEQELPIICEFFDNGIIEVYPYQIMEKPISLLNDYKWEALDSIIKNSVNPLIGQLKPFLEQSGLFLPLFLTINHPNVEMRNIQYQCLYNITKTIDIQKYSGCISSVFTIESDNFKKGIQLRYKRVSNFNKRDSQEAFIIEKIDQGFKMDEIIHDLQTQFNDLDEESATDLIIKIRSELEVTRGSNKRRALMIKINPGFKTNMDINLITSELIVKMSGINDIHYLDIIPIYIDTILRITQDPKSTSIPTKVINNLCSASELEDITFDSITALPETAIFTNEVPILEKEQIIYPSLNLQEEEENLEEENVEEGENMEELLDLLGFDSESEEEEEEGEEEKEKSNKESNSYIGGMNINNDNINTLSSLPSSPIVPITKNKQSISELKDNAKLMENTVRDITGMKLKYPNPFSARLEERMPELFVKAKNEKFDLYTRMCPFSLSDRRQPVILTKEEKDRIIKDHPGNLNEEADFIEYGTNDDNKYYFTCPRYWCLLTDTMVTEQEILDGKCGKKVDKIEDAIIPNKADEVPKDKFVYKFYNENEKKYPGFHKQKTPSGSCIPCCYSNWSTAEMKNRRDICQGKFKKESAEKVLEKEEEVEEKLQNLITESDQYIKGPEKFGPQLGEHRWGYLPIVVQKFLNDVNSDCQVNKMSQTNKPNVSCILRHGVESSSTQSFIACIASAIFYGQKDEKTKQPLITAFIKNAKQEVPTIKQMKNIIIKAIDLDHFIKYQNGDLATIFVNTEIKIDLEKYKNTQLFKKINSNTNPSNTNPTKISIQQTQFLIKVAQAYENFKLYLLNDKIEIDYTYLWDLISMPNPLLFEAGINLIILEIPEDDITNNINLVCPSNHYSSLTFDTRRRSLILLKRENYYEPIYGYKNNNNKILVTKTFSEYDKNMSKSLRNVFTKIIKPTLEAKCKPLLSRPKEYKFKQPIILDKLIEELLERRYKIEKQVLNFQGKVIGLLVINNKKMVGFIPCFPSSLTSNKQTGPIDFIYANDNIWQPYEETLEFLKIYYNYEEPKNVEKANCFNPNYFCKVVEDEMITGFLTNTNQFIPIKDPLPLSNLSKTDSIKTIKTNNLLVADNNTLVNSGADSKRIQFINKIQLEMSFFNTFRNTIRILFNDYTNSKKRKEIQDECNKRYSLYKIQLDVVIDLLKDLVKDYIIFTDNNDIFKDLEEKDVTTCNNIENNNNCSGKLCKMTKNKCVLILPKKNLVNQTDNDKLYFSRMADELIRYNRIKSFIFKPQVFLSFGPLKYNINKDEIIILQDLLNIDFFENLTPAEINKYALYNTYDTTQPIITQKYTSNQDINDLLKPIEVKECKISSPEAINSIQWKKCFPKEYKQIVYSESNTCPLLLLMDIIKNVKKQEKSIEDIKQDLIHMYNTLTNNYTNKERIDKIIDILKEESWIDITLIQAGVLTFEQMIIDETFIAVNFDLWLLLVYYKVPSIFISSKNIPETRYNYHEFVCYTKDNNKNFTFILTPAMYKKVDKKLPEYKIIVGERDTFIIDIDNLKERECINNIENAIKNYTSIEDYIDYIFERDIKTKYKPKKQGLRKVELIEVEEEVDENKDYTKPIDDNKLKKVQKWKGKKIQPMLVLEEDLEKNKEDKEIDKEDKEMNKEDKEMNKEEEIFFEITPVLKPKKEKKTRKQKVLVNPPGKRNTKRKLPEDVIIMEEESNIN